MDELKKQVESVLFSVGRKIELQELAKLVRESDLSKVLGVLEQLRGEYEAHGGSLMVVQDGTAWKLTVREAYLGTVRKIVTQTELPKSVMETLAVIAYKNPVLQSHIIKVRTNKAYDHLSLLESDGFLTRVKKGRTKLIRLSPKFFQYFDIPEDQLKQKFSNVLALEKAIEEKEGEIETKNKELLANQETLKQHDEAHKKHVAEEHKRLDEELSKMPEVDLVDDEGNAHALEEYKTTPIKETEEKHKLAPSVQVISETGLETYGEQEIEPVPMPGGKKKKKQQTKATPKISPEMIAQLTKEAAAASQAATPAEDATLAEARKAAAEEIAAANQEPETPKITEEQIDELAEDIASGEKKSREFGGQGIFPKGVPEDVEKKIDKRVDEIVHGNSEEEKNE